MNIVCLCPLAKVFQPRYTLMTRRDLEVDRTVQPISKLLDTPELIAKTDPFLIVVKNSRRSFEFTYGEPVLISDVVPGYDTMDPKEVATLRRFLVGGNNGVEFPETDFTGLVEITFKDKNLAATLEYYKNSGQKIPPQLQKEYDAALQLAKQNSEARVWRAVEKTYKRAQNQVTENERNKVGAPDFSVTELLCAHLMRDKMKADVDLKKKAQDLYASL